MLDLRDEDLRLLHSQAPLEGVSLPECHANIPYPGAESNNQEGLSLSPQIALLSHDRSGNAAGHVSATLASHKFRSHAHTPGKEGTGTEEGG